MTTGQKESTEQASAGFRVSAYGTHGSVPKEAELDWFFSVGQSLFEASTFGALLERQANYGQTFDTCGKCGGSGFDAGDNTCPTCRGMGGQPKPRDQKSEQTGLLFSTSRCLACIQRRPKLWSCKTCDGYGCFPESGARCVACKASGMKLLKSGKIRRRPKRKRPEVCWACNNSRFHERRPVAVKAESGGEPSYTPDDVALRRFAQISRYLRQCSGSTLETLATFFGLSGFRWADTKWGRLFALAPFTDEGELLLDEARSEQEISDHELLENEVNRLDKLTNIEHKQRAQNRLEKLTREAAELFRAAAVEWRSVVDPRADFEDIQLQVDAA